TVISTEAAHGLIVSSAAEKSASLPRQHLSHRRVSAVVLGLGNLTNQVLPDPQKINSSLTARLKYPRKYRPNPSS
ncbi:MAG TPA: hypothetical protein VNV63_01015, partial [Nitrospiria bacterium]|nr:hypothetical protein [Nitrospiria bacterium]